MKLTTLQKKSLLDLFHNTNDKFISFLVDSHTNDKFMKIKNIIDSLAKSTDNEESLFFIGNNDLGKQKNIMAITTLAIYIKDTFDELHTIYLKDIIECKLIKEGTNSTFGEIGIFIINNIRISNNYLRNSNYMIVNIINKLVEIYRENIIIQENLNVYKSIIIDSKLATEGGQYKDLSDYSEISIFKGIQDGTVLNFREYGKSYGHIKGDLFVKVNIDETSGKNFNEEKKIIEYHNFNDDLDLTLIVSCANCNKEIVNYVSNICPYCNEDANIKKEKNPNKFKIALSKDNTISEVQNKFKSQTELFLRVYQGKSQINPNEKLLNLKDDISIEISTRMKIETIEKLFEDVGIKVQIASSDNTKLCDNKISLAKAKEKYLIKGKR